MKVLISLLFFVFTLFGASYSCPGQNVANINSTTFDAYKEYSTTNKSVGNNGGRYFKFKTAVGGAITISQDTLKNENGYKNHKLKIGTSCNGTDIRNGTGKTHDSKTFNVSANTTFYVKIQEGNTKNKLNVKVKFDFIADSPVVNDASDICYEDFTEQGFNFGFVGFFLKTSMPVKNINDNTLSNIQTALGTSNLFSVFTDCGVDNGDGSETCEDANNKSFMMFSAFNNGVDFNLNTLNQNQSKTPWTKSLFSFFNSSDYDMVASYKKNGILHQGKMKPCPISYCETHQLTEGFHVIDPDGGDDKNSFEVFCHKDTNNIWHDLIALPMKNSSNNFTFNNETTSLNYYDVIANPRTPFNAIEIDGGHITYNGIKPEIPVIQSRSDNAWQITTDGKSYNVMGKTFSNINLIGTPFTINWDNTEVYDCNATALRKALNQAVKYNTLTQDNHSICKIKNMNLSLLDDYHYLTYNNNEVLQHSCKEMATYVPNNILLDSSINGHFNILPSEPAYPDQTPITNGTRDNSTDIGAQYRPITVSCQYQQDLGYVWTFLTALDAKVTVSKDDLVGHQDSCSQLGLYFYVPNNKETFNRVRKYLKSEKDGPSGWEDYTGTINEKIQALHNNNQYYLSKFKNVLIWPYGPLGIYYPCNGNKDATDGCKSKSWYSGTGSIRTWMSGSAMHNIHSESNYDDSMGKNGWVSILGSQDLNKTDDWWISDIGAGEEIGNPNPTYSPHGTHPIQSDGYKYYEPNGNYTKNAWLNFLFDSDGWIYHNDDWNNNYPYYDYMCMSETNYDTASRYTLVPGFFNAIERIRNPVPQFSDANLTTQIVANPIQFDILLYKLNTNGTVNRSQLETNHNRSVGVFLSSITGNQAPHPIQFLGEYNNFDSNNGRIQLSDFSTSSAIKRAVIQFYYCSASDANWTSCWDYNGVANSPTITSTSSEAQKIDSTDDFAIRPDRFDIITPSANHVIRAEENNITYYAYNYNSTTPTPNYNENFSSLEFNTSLSDTTKPCQNISLDLQANKFEDGVETNATTFSNIGKWHITLKEIDGEEFAKVDMDDGTSNQQYGLFITPADINLTVIPSYFNISIIANINHANNFTYLSNELDKMAINFDLNVTAKNSQGYTTPNYTSTCYADNTNIEIKYDPLSSPFNGNIIYKEGNSTNESNNSASDNNLSFASLPKSLFVSGDNNGTAIVKLKINFERNVSTAHNPFKVHFNDINVSDKSYNPVICWNKNQHIIDKNATMYYGRTHAPRTTITGTDGNVSIYYEVFCNGVTCNKAFLQDGINSAYTDDPRWFVNTQHIPAKDGNISSVKQKNGVLFVTSGVLVNNIGKTLVPLTYHDLRGYPYKATMENNASGWLIYNKYNANATTNEFEVEFVKPGGAWAGEHETNTTTDTNASQRTNRRVMW